MSDNKNFRQKSNQVKKAFEESKAQIAAAATEGGKRKLKDLMIIVIVTVLLLGVYYYFVQMWEFQMIFGVYMAAWVISFMAYWMYNRGFSRKDVTPEMLPKEWSDERKQQFIDDGIRRMQKSRWLLYIIIPLCFVFMAEIIMTYIWPNIYQTISNIGA